MDFWDEWFKRFGRRPFFFGDIKRFIEEIEREMADGFKDMENMPEKMSREIRLPDGSIRRVYGPFVYGYSVKIGPNGRPVIREFGNMKPGLAAGGSNLNLSECREPLVDTIEDGNLVKVLAELPGVEKKDIKLFATSNKLTINVDTPDRKYFKEIDFLFEIDASSAKSKYHNGVLEVSLEKKTIKEEGIALYIN